MFKIATSRVPHSRGGETFQTVADAMAAVDTLPSVTLGDVVAVRMGTSWEDEAAWKALEAAKAHQASEEKASEDAAKVVAIAADLAAREAKLHHDRALDAVAADKIVTDAAAKGK